MLVIVNQNFIEDEDDDDKITKLQRPEDLLKIGGYAPQIAV